MKGNEDPDYLYTENSREPINSELKKSSSLQNTRLLYKNQLHFNNHQSIYYKT